MKLITPKSSIKQHDINEKIQNRTVLAVGKQAVSRFAGLKCGIVGAGGLGIIVAELLARLGVKYIAIIDYDSVDYSNLNRFLSATNIDAQLNTPKTTVAARLIASINPSIEVDIVNGDFLENNNQECFKSCDFIFGSSDSVGVRLAINHLCLANGTGYFDLGCGVKTESGKMTAAGGQIIKITPSSGFCINCCGMFDINKAYIDFVDPDESARQRAMGYVDGENLPQASVYALNMMVASQAVWLMMRLVAGEKLDFDGVYIDALTLKSYPWSEKIKRQERKENPCIVCGDSGIEFSGDDAGLLERESVKNEFIPENTFQRKSENRIKPKVDSAHYGKPNKQIEWDVRIILDSAVMKTY